MFVTSLSELRKHPREYLECIMENTDALIINDENGEDIVMFSLDEYNAIQDTLHELSSKRNQATLDASIEQLENGEVREEDLAL